MKLVMEELNDKLLGVGRLCDGEMAVVLVYEEDALRLSCGNAMQGGTCWEGR